MNSFVDYTRVRKLLWLGCSAAVLTCGSLGWAAVRHHPLPVLDISFTPDDEADQEAKPAVGRRRCCDVAGGPALRFSGEDGPGGAATVGGGPPRAAPSKAGGGVAVFEAHEDSAADQMEPASDPLMEDLENALRSAFSASVSVGFGHRMPAMGLDAAGSGFPDWVSPGPRAKLLQRVADQLPVAPLAPNVVTAAAGAVPEPGAWLMLIGGAFGLGGALRASRRRTATA